MPNNTAKPLAYFLAALIASGCVTCLISVSVIKVKLPQTIVYLIELRNLSSSLLNSTERCQNMRCLPIVTDFAVGLLAAIH